MNNSASGLQRTGQPKWVQLIEKAVKLSSLSLLNQAAVLAVTPAHGRGDAWRNVTATVSPTLNDSSCPTERQKGGKALKRGLKTKPTIGTPTIIEINPPRMKINLSKKVRLDIFPRFPLSMRRLFSLMAHFPQPAR